MLSFWSVACRISDSILSLKALNWRSIASMRSS